MTAASACSCNLARCWAPTFFSAAAASRPAATECLKNVKACGLGSVLLPVKPSSVPAGPCSPGLPCSPSPHVPEPPDSPALASMLSCGASGAAGGVPPCSHNRIWLRCAYRMSPAASCAEHVHGPESNSCKTLMQQKSIYLVSTVSRQFQ